VDRGDVAHGCGDDRRQVVEIQLQPLEPEEGAQVQVPRRGEQRQPVAVRAGEFVRAQQPAGAGHVLGDDGRVAGDVVAQMRGDQPAEGVGAATGRERDDDADGLPGIIVLGADLAGSEGQGGDGAQKGGGGAVVQHVDLSQFWRRQHGRAR
jgi:hypothetical protein